MFARVLALEISAFANPLEIAPVMPVRPLMIAA